MAKDWDSKKWEKEIKAFEAADRANPPPRGAVLFIGSSTIRFWTTLAQDFPDYKVLNRGFGGCHIADCTYYADRIVIPYEPRLIVFRAGGNDIAAGMTPEQVRDDYQAFVEKVRAKLPEVRIAYMSINATPSRWANVAREAKANQLIKDYVDGGKNLDFIDACNATLDSDGKPRGTVPQGPFAFQSRGLQDPRLGSATAPEVDGLRSSFARQAAFFRMFSRFYSPRDLTPRGMFLSVFQFFFTLFARRGK